MKKRCVVVAAGPISKYEKIRSYLNPETDFYIFCDNGIAAQKKLGVCADLILGDFDSHRNPAEKDSELEKKTLVLPRAKDDTDSVYAVKYALKKGFKDFLLLGMCGARMDHCLVNIYLLYFLFEQKVNAKIVDDFSEMQIVGKNPVFVEDSWKYFSLVNICGTSKGVNIKNAKFPLENAVIENTFQYATSNETLPGKTAEISVEEGSLLLIKIFDTFN